MKEIVIVDGVRTPMGRSKGGAFRFVRAEDLSAKLMLALLERNPEIAPQEIEDVYWGCVQQTLEQGFNIARNASLLAGLPKSIGGITVNRLCGSSMQALHDAVRALACGDGDIMLVGGVEHMGHVPMTHGLDFHPLMARHVARASGMMGMTAEMLARKYKITRKQQDEFALRSHQAAHQATIQGRFQKEIVPIAGHDSQGILQIIRTDEVIRAETSIAQLEALKPAFDPVSGSVTAGSSSAISDGAAALLVMTAEKARSLGVRAKVKIKAMAGSGCDPAIMGIGPVLATKKALERAKLNMSSIDLVEINEAFAAQSIPCLQELELYDFIDSKVNLNGGAIALGHPLGCSGARLTTTLMYLMQEKDATLGLATMCIGLGQGIATIFERV